MSAAKPHNRNLETTLEVENDVRFSLSREPCYLMVVKETTLEAENDVSVSLSREPRYFMVVTYNNQPVSHSSELRNVNQS